MSKKDYSSLFEDKIYEEIKADYNGVEVSIKQFLSLKDMANFVAYVVNMSFKGVSSSYTPEFTEYAIRCAIVESYTDIELPLDAEGRHNIIFGTDIIRFITSQIEMAQFNSMLKAIDRKIKYNTSSNMKLIEEKISEVVKQIEEVGNAFNGLLGGMSQEDISKMVSFVSSGEFTAQNIIKEITKTDKEEEYVAYSDN